MSEKRRKILIVVFAALVAGITAGVIYSGVTLEECEERISPTLQTSAVVTDKEEHRYQYTSSYLVYLDFSTSRMDAELVDLLTQRRQCIECSSEEFNHFYGGQKVMVVYHVVETELGLIKVAIESVDGYQPERGLDDLITPGQEKSECITPIVGGGVGIAICAGILFWLIRQRRKAKPKMP